MNNHIEQQICSRCVMDTSAANIQFDSDGTCSYCSEFLDRSSHILFKSEEDRARDLKNFTTKIKAEGKGKRYDCIIGVSGGVDSSWALVQAIKLGLRPLAVHMDNGWNSEMAQNNIANLVNGLGVDLHTHVINWEEYRSLMQAFFDADVIDVELLYDNAMLAVNYNLARKHGIKSILAGTNQATEGMKMPTEWNWFKRDKRNIKAIGKRFTNTRVKTFPCFGSFQYIYCEFFKKIKWHSFLNYFDYQKENAICVLEREHGYKRYPYKHYESVFTRFYQGYILPNKFGVDKRKLHLGTLVASKQMTREKAIEELKNEPYPNAAALAEDIQYFLKKMRWSNEDLESYISRPEIPHDTYPSERRLYEMLLSERSAKIYRALTFKQKASQPK